MRPGVWGSLPPVRLGVRLIRLTGRFVDVANAYSVRAFCGGPGACVC